MSTTTLPISGLTCHRCAETVTEQINQISGVSAVSVDVVTGGVSTVTVTAERDLSDDEVQAALSQGGAFVIAR